MIWVRLLRLDRAAQGPHVNPGDWNGGRGMAVMRWLAGWKGFFLERVTGTVSRLANLHLVGLHSGCSGAMTSSRTSSKPGFPAPIGEHIWDLKYRLKSNSGESIDRTLDDTFRRVARAAASAEVQAGGAHGGKADPVDWEQIFHDAMADFGFLPAGRILAGAGSGRDVTLFNCFVMGPVPDSLNGIFDSVKSSALTLQSGGGIGVDFSTLRPRGALVASIGAEASGPVSFMDVWDAMCRTIMSAGARRGAMMATMRADHPDIEEFIDAKTAAGRLTNFNVSVLVPDALMVAVRDDAGWELSFDGTSYRSVRARDLWEKIMRATFDAAEPGVIFIDRVNARNNLAYCETIAATNPCGEQPLPPFGACLLGSINLTAFVKRPFQPDAGIDLKELTQRVGTAVRFLDNLIEVSSYPLREQAREAKAKRRIGLGLTGLADALIMCGINYDSAKGRDAGAEWMAAIQHAAYRSSIVLAEEKGAFPLFDAEAFLAGPTVSGLPTDIRDGIAKHGIRNGCLTSIAPTGTISLFAGNVSSGIEPVFDMHYQRRIIGADGATDSLNIEDFAYRRYRSLKGGAVELPSAFVTATRLSPRAHLSMQAALQPFVDSAISKTINCPEAISFADFESIYGDAYDLGLKGCTTYRPSGVRGSVIEPSPDGDVSPPRSAPASGREIADGLRREGNRDAGVVYMSEPLSRDPALAGFTYKIKWAGSDHAIYVTINDIERDGRRRPFEIFINTKNLEHYAWTVALTRMISAVFRRGGDVSFVAEELKAVFDPQGGQWVDGRYIPSLLAAIGDVIEGHMLRIGFFDAAEDGEVAGAAPGYGGGEVLLPHERAKRLAGGLPVAPSPGKSAITPSAVEAGAQIQAVRRGRPCPRCGSALYVKSEGCWVCSDCGFSRCD